VTAIETVAERSVTEALEAMLLIRTFEEKSAALKAAGQSPSMCTSVGQEASAVGVVRNLGKDDLILTNHRSAGHLLARGADPGRLFAEIMGKSTGYCKGKSGSLHISVKELGVVLTSTIVGGELSLAPGVGLSLSMSQSDAIAVVFSATVPRPRASSTSRSTSRRSGTSRCCTSARTISGRRTCTARRR
jgi:pyruvate dehydrogenase E1 component alpha subunit